MALDDAETLDLIEAPGERRLPTIELGPGPRPNQLADVAAQFVRNEDGGNVTRPRPEGSVVAARRPAAGFR